MPHVRQGAAGGIRFGRLGGHGPAVTSKNLKLRELAGEDAKAPWHFKVLMVLLGIYLGWRLVQLARPGLLKRRPLAD